MKSHDGESANQRENRKPERETRTRETEKKKEEGNHDDGFSSKGIKQQQQTKKVVNVTKVTIGVYR